MSISSNKKRCSWVEKGNELYESYHDNEWGIPVHEDRKHFELLCLEGAQTGLSWITILKKREAYRIAFEGFDPSKVALFNDDKASNLLKNQEIVRNKLKIQSAIKNAKAFLKIQKEFGSFDYYVWSFVANKTIYNRWKDKSQLPQKSPESIALSKDLKKRGFSFVGPVVIYSYMQAAGLVHDHFTYCFCHKEGDSPNWEVYIILTSTGSFYTGITKDLNRRFSEHESGKKGARFFHISSLEAIVFREAHPSRSSASQRESQIKKMTKKQKEDLIKNQKNVD